MNKKWAVGARAVIVYSNHFENMNRVVELKAFMGIIDDYIAGKSPNWNVYDGKSFKGYLADVYPPTLIDSHPERFCISQWKMRLLDDDEKTINSTETGIEYAIC